MAFQPPKMSWAAILFFYFLEQFVQSRNYLILQSLVKLICKSIQAQSFFFKTYVCGLFWSFLVLYFSLP